MKKLLIILFIVFTATSVSAQFGSTPFPDNLIIYDDGDRVLGKGKRLDFTEHINVTYDSLSVSYKVKVTEDSLTLNDLADVNSSTQTSGNLLLSNGLTFNSVALSGDCTVDGTGVTTCGGAGSAWEADVNDDLMPIVGTFTAILWQADGNDDIMPLG